ncbi:Non-specific lipid-transfer protein [Escovopsis weberi]|uniref:propanoyl-CoA C-acyltransferase n=1 Tax=Escovopsis weberi TaxID=150374 RepID=A0A0M8N3B1_ESCWE|nr:Non-specific lipid-transfer protein [Escovopsis weberi]
MAPNEPVYVLGVGMTKFIKPRGKVSYTELGFEAGVKALLDAGITYDDISTAVAAYCYGDSTCGQRVLYQLGMTGIPIYNTNNNCATGGTALALAGTLVGSGAAEAVMVLGFETMAPGSLESAWKDRESPLGPAMRMMQATRGSSAGAPAPAQLFGNAGREYMERHGARAEDFAEIARVNHAHSAGNPYAQFREAHSLEQVLASPAVHAPLTKLQCCPTSDGAAAAVLVSRRFLDARPRLRARAVEMAGRCVATDGPALYSGGAIDLVGFGMTQRAARAALRDAGIAARDVQVVELHDCFSTNEMLALDALGLCEPGTAHEMVRRGDITHGGRVLVNPSGGLISKGHPLGATGVAQCAELVWHLRGWANNRATPAARPTRHCLQHNLGLGGAVFVAVYRRADGLAAPVVDSETVARESGLGYNPAVEARGFTAAQADRVRSQKARSEFGLQDAQNKVLSKF